MSKPKLVISHDERKGVFRIIWQFDDDMGGTLGQNKDNGLGPAPTDKDDWEHWAACKAIMEAPVRQYSRDVEGFFWREAASAKAALALAKAAIKAERPMPEWAQQAIQNGWRAPKGWKP